ncbi:hypothetical protein I6E17_00635 [Fusobacterium perfoetens]|uniref:hypothetical protein n=1 Tax=Fusobacterium perfoetens TaxID=852 RepID=UPI0015A2BBF5|nr:hypothetical protein [Fusobacterium perfoetens]MCF2624684.1 hypothetical protein [Fusobacterium perfoetens]
MKKTALLLGAVLAVSSSAYAKEVLPVVEEVQETVVIAEVTPEPLIKSVTVGQSLEVDNTSGQKNIGESVIFMNTAELNTENWDFTIGAGKVFSSDTRHREGGLYDRGTSRMELQAIRNFDNWFLGVKVQSNDNYDRWYLRTGYDYGMFSGWMDAQYYSQSGNYEDYGRIEIMPFNVTFGPIKVGYYLDYIDYTGKGQVELNDKGGVVEKGNILEKSADHQLRFYAPLYTGEKLGLTLEYRLGLHNSADYSNLGKDKGYRVYKDFNYNALIVNANYALNDSFDIYGYYRYDISKYEAKKGIITNEDNGKYYGEFQIGWAYTF